MPSFVDRTGHQFGALTALSPTLIKLSSGRSVVGWLCRCECGNEAVFHAVNLAAGRTRSCGCKQHVRKKPRIRDVPEYSGYSAMLRRCLNPKHLGV
jgi:hypothetical protein